MKLKKTILILSVAVFATGCASMKESLVVGAGSGAAIGAGIGSSSNQKNRGKGAAVGALIGAAVGLIGGRAVHKSLEKRDNETRKQTLFNIDKFGVSGANGGFSPAGHHGLTMPKVDSEWIPTSVQGKKLIEGHRVWLISEDPQWIPGKSSKKSSK